MFEVRRLRLLRDLDRLGTIASVAAAHSYTPSAVSQQLTVLEREAGVPLLERRGRGVMLTSPGRILVQHAEEILAALERADAAVATARTGLAGTLRVGAFPTAVRTLLTGALVSLGTDHPGLDLMVTELDPVAVPDALRERRIDAALVHDYDVVPAGPDPAVETVPLLDETVFLATVDRGGPDVIPCGLRDVRDADWITGSPGTLCHAVALHACRAAGFTAEVRHVADDFVTVLALVASGQGVALVPQLAVPERPAGVRLVPLDIRRRTMVAYRRGSGGHPAVAAFTHAVRASADAHPTGPDAEALARRRSES